MQTNPRQVSSIPRNGADGQLELLPHGPAVGQQRGYDPIPSVWAGDDADLLERMLEFYPNGPAEPILDATVNVGRFWRGSRQRVTGLDVDPRYRPDIVGDSMCLPCRDGVFGTVVYDPPHVPNQGHDDKKDFKERFGLRLTASAENGYNLSHMYGPFVREAYRVLRPDGILLCKITDYVHNHRLQWAHIDLVLAAREAGFCACDCIVKVRKGPIVHPGWKVAHHSRRHHCYWLVFRKSQKCE